MRGGAWAWVVVGAGGLLLQVRATPVAHGMDNAPGDGSSVATSTAVTIQFGDNVAGSGSFQKSYEVAWAPSTGLRAACTEAATDTSVQCGADGYACKQEHRCF